MSNTNIINVRGIANSVQMEKSRSSGMLNYTRNHNTMYETAENPETSDFKESLFKLTNLHFVEKIAPNLKDHKLLIEGELDKLITRSKSNFITNSDLLKIQSKLNNTRS